MAYQTGTVARLNDVIRTLRDFLVAQGWTIHVDYREPILMSVRHDLFPPPAHDTLLWRWGQRLAMSKGTKFFAMQDFYQTHDFSYGTVGNINGPGIALVAGTSAADDGKTEAYWTALWGSFADWYRLYTLASDGVTPVYGQRGDGPIQIPGWANDVNNPSPIMIMPLPQVAYQESGSWTAASTNWVNSPGPSDSTHPLNDAELYAPFGNPDTGVQIPLKYWLMYDGADDSWMMVTKHDTIATTIKTPYMGMGTLKKAGDWAGTGDFVCASHARTNAFTGTDVTTYGIFGHEINRFAPPGGIADDGGMTFAVRMPIVDSSPATWQGIGSGGRRLFSTVEMELIPGSTGPLGTKSGLGYGQLTTLRSSVMDGAPGKSIFLTIQRDSGLQSMIGSVPNIFQARTFGFPFGAETLAPNGNTYVVFDGFMIKKVP
jgi:hypothetical protein